MRALNNILFYLPGQLSQPRGRIAFMFPIYLSRPLLRDDTCRLESHIVLVALERCTRC